VINHDASFNCTNIEKLQPVAVTWGVFPGVNVIKSFFVVAEDKNKYARVLVCGKPFQLGLIFADSVR
jgi:hypothetical protein